MTTIVKAGSFCPACMATVCADCHHTTDDFRRSLSGYKISYVEQLENEITALRKLMEPTK